jgi:hypothetical protein
VAPASAHVRRFAGTKHGGFFVIELAAFEVIHDLAGTIVGRALIDDSI